MPLEPFDEIFDDRDDGIVNGVDAPALFVAFGLPPGEYFMRELYCTDPDCDCQFVQVHFIHESCLGLTPKSERAMKRAYGWPLAGGRRQGPIAAAVNYCWRRPKQQAYVKLGQEHGHWLKLDRVTLDFLGPQTPMQRLFRIWLRVLLEQEPSLRQLFRRHYRAVKSRGKSRGGSGPQSWPLTPQAGGM